MTVRTPGDERYATSLGYLTLVGRSTSVRGDRDLAGLRCDAVVPSADAGGNSEADS